MSKLDMEKYAEKILDSLSAEGREAFLDACTQIVYELCDRQFAPMFPWVFVRVLPKDNKQGSIIIPGFDQNKTIHEGIVLATWKPWVKVVDKYHKDKGVIQERVSYRSELSAGDHVLFLHWAGAPIAGFSDKHYRVVKESEWSSSQEGGIFATVDYSDKEKREAKLLDTVLTAPAVRRALEEEIRNRYMLLDYDQHSVTLSGR